MPVGVPELVIILVIIVIIFGVGKLPEIGGALGKGIREFKTESSDDENGKIEAGTSATASDITASTNGKNATEAVPAASGNRADEI